MTARQRLADLGIVAAIATVCALLSRPWTGFNSPDAEFYASYAIFGGDVADRAIEPAYTWTRLGMIAPTRLLVAVFGPWWGFGIWRFVLVLAFVGGLYALVRMASSRRLAFVVALLAGLGTIVLSYFGTTYLTGACLALISLLVATAAWAASGGPRVLGLPWPALLAGGLLGWLAMVNPYAMLLGGSLAVATRLAAASSLRQTGITWLLEAAALAIGAVVVAGLFLASGLALFPGRSWLGTYLEWNGKLDYTAFVGDWTTWQRDTALLVVVLSIAVSLMAWWSVRSRWARAALAIAVANVAFTVLFMLVQPGPWLEAPTYVALLWPGALAATGLAVAALVGDARIGWPALLLAVLAVPAMAWLGRWDGDLALPIAWLLIAALTAAFLGLALARRRGWRFLALGCVSWLVAASLAGQVLQNGRGLLGTYGQFPFRAAYVDFDMRLLMASRIDAQSFVLDQTRDGDRIGIWTDPARLTSGLAAMQLWGDYNVVSFGDTADEERLARMGPTVIAMYAPSRAQIDRFWASLPPDAAASVPACTQVPYLGIGSPTATVCVTRLAR